MKATEEVKAVNLVGMWFHSWAEEELQWQGQVIGRENGGAHYFVQLYEWADGCKSVIRLVSLEDMQPWGFYKTNRDMKEAYAEYIKRKQNDPD